MPPFGSDPEGPRARGQLIVAGFFALAALATTYMPEAAQQRAAAVIRVTALRPFLGAQQRWVDTRIRSAEVDELREELDSAITVLSTQSAMADENRTLRSLLDLSGRVGPDFRPAAVLRSGTPGSQSMFLISLGRDDSVHVGAPVVDYHGLVGLISEVGEHRSVGMDWSHPDFRASAMLEDGSAYGIVENRRGENREDDRLVFTGGAYYEDIVDGTVVLTSGLAGVLPRGIVIGRIDGVAEVQAEWRKNYWIRPMVTPAEATHVLVRVGDRPAPAPRADGDSTTVRVRPDTLTDFSGAWPPDSAMSRSELWSAQKAAYAKLPALEDSLTLLKIRLGIYPDSLLMRADSTNPEIRAAQRAAEVERNVVRPAPTPQLPAARPVSPAAPAADTARMRSDSLARDTTTTPPDTLQTAFLSSPPPARTLFPTVVARPATRVRR